MGLDLIIGMRVVSVERIHDFTTTIFFSGGAGLTIYNNFRGDPDSVIGSVVDNISVHQYENFEIFFSNGQTLDVGLKDNDYNGPEAFVFVDSASGTWIICQ